MCKSGILNRIWILKVTFVSSSVGSTIELSLDEAQVQKILVILSKASYSFASYPSRNSEVLLEV